MTRRLQTVIYDSDPDERSESLYSSAEITDGVVRRARATPVLFHRDVARIWRYEMSRLPSVATGWYDTTATTATVKQAVRGGALMREWARIELLYSAPTNTTVEARLHDGTDEVYWDGAAWSVAGATDWNTPDEVEANFSSLSATTYPSIGIEWRLQTSDKRATPVVYGGLIAGRILLMHRYQGAGDTPDESITGSDSWADDLVHRVLIPWFIDSVEPERTDQRILTATATALDYSAGVDDSAYVVKTVQAVYDIDSDANMRSPLAGSWNASTKVWTPTTPIASGTQIAVRLVYEPLVAYQGDRHLFTEAIPQIVIEKIDRIADLRESGSSFVRRCTDAAFDALKLPAALWREYQLAILMQADGNVTALEIGSAIERALGSGLATVSGGTGMQVYVSAGTATRPLRAAGRLGGAARIDLRAWVAEYHGDETTTPIIKTDGFVPTFVTGRTNYKLE